MENLFKLRLPHPYLTSYELIPLVQRDSTTEGLHIHGGLLQLQRGQSLKSCLEGIEPPEDLLNPDLSFAAPHAGGEDDIPVANNGPWARARRSLQSEVRWIETPPTLGQLWLLSYAVFILRPELEQVRLCLDGPEMEKVRHSITASTLANPHPPNINNGTTEVVNEVLLQRATFWQGAGSPFGEGSVWIPRDSSRPTKPFILSYTLTTKFPNERVHTWHPQRTEKPAPGSVIYSRYIPHLDEQFSMVAMDYQNDEHLNLFHNWQNDPRVAQGWNESGTWRHHYDYLKRMHEDPHQIAILAYFENIPFAYFEVYWAKEDHLGAYYPAGDFDRGRHSLVGDKRYRGRHRVTAWWSSLMHYIFLDDPRTMCVVGEPKWTNTSVLEYDLMSGFSMHKAVDLPHKRSAFMMCSRERFFQLSPLDSKGGFVGGTNIVIAARM